MNNKILLKKLPLLTVLTASLVLSPAISIAGNSDHNYSESKVSHDDRRSHSKNYNRSSKHHDNRSNKHVARSYGKSHKGKYGHNTGYRYDRGHGHHNNQVRYIHYHDDHRYDRHTTYVVNEHHYDDGYYGMDPLRFMISLHTNNFDITFRD